jgi:hypothetical protein
MKSNDLLHALLSRDKLEMYTEVMRRLDDIVDNLYSITIRFLYSNHLDCWNEFNYVENSSVFFHMVLDLL